MPAGMLADREKHRLGALIGERLEDAVGIARPRAVVERQHDFMVAQEVVSFEMLEAETGAAGGVDLHHARNAECVRIVALGRRRGVPERRVERRQARPSARQLGPACSAPRRESAADTEIARAIAKALRITFSIRGKSPYSENMIYSSRL